MSNTIISQNTGRSKTAIHLITTGQVTPNGREGQCFISTDDGLYLATATACTCGQQPCPHTLAAAIYNHWRARTTAFLKRHNEQPMTLFWRLRDELDTITTQNLASKIEIVLTICQQLHREERKREINTFYSVCASSGGGVMFCPVPPKRRGRGR